MESPFPVKAGVKPSTDKLGIVSLSIPVEMYFLPLCVGNYTLIFAMLPQCWQNIRFYMWSCQWWYSLLAMDCFGSILLSKGNTHHYIRIICERQSWCNEICDAAG